MIRDAAAYVDVMTHSMPNKYHDSFLRRLGQYGWRMAYSMRAISMIARAPTGRSASHPGRKTGRVLWS